MLSLLRLLLTWRYPHRPLHHGARSCRSICPTHRAVSSKPAGRRCCCRSMGQTDRRTDRPLHRPCCACYAGSVNNVDRSVVSRQQLSFLCRRTDITPWFSGGVQSHIFTIRSRSDRLKDRNGPSGLQPMIDTSFGPFLSTVPSQLGLYMAVSYRRHCPLAICAFYLSVVHIINAVWRESRLAKHIHGHITRRPSLSVSVNPEEWMNMNECFIHQHRVTDTIQ